MISSAWNGLRSSRVVGEGQSIAMVPTLEVNTGVMTTTMTEQVSHVALQAPSSVGYFLIINYFCSGNIFSNTAQTSYSACSSACLADNNCVAFGWSPTGTGVNCYLKSALPGLSCVAYTGSNMYFNVAAQATTTE